MINDKQERCLLADWLGSTKHREDTKYFEEELFIRKNVFQAIKQGKTYEQILAASGTDITASEIYNAMMNVIDYREAKTEALIEQKNIYLERAKKRDLTKWVAKADEIQNVIDDKQSAPKISGFKEMFLKDFHERANENNPQYGRGLKYLDKATKGLHRGELTTIGARPGVGKSAMSLQIAYNVAMQDFKVIYVPLEMTVEAMLGRTLKQTQTVSPDEYAHPNDYIEEQIGLFLDRLEEDGSFNFCTADKVGLIKQKVKTEKPFLLVIDQLSLLYPDEPYGNERERFKANTRELKKLALEENISILLMSQINREGKERKVPTLEDLSESDSIGQDSDNVLLLYSLEEPDENAMRTVFLKIEKQRNGASGMKIPLKYDGSRFTFNAVETR